LSVSDIIYSISSLVAFYALIMLLIAC